MQRVAFTMKLKPGCADEYQRRHENLWPELHSLLQQADISDYSIFLDETTHVLFAVQKVSGTGSLISISFAILSFSCREVSDYFTRTRKIINNTSYEIEINVYGEGNAVE